MSRQTYNYNTCTYINQDENSLQQQLNPSKAVWAYKQNC